MEEFRFSLKNLRPNALLKDTLTAYRMNIAQDVLLIAMGTFYFFDNHSKLGFLLCGLSIINIAGGILQKNKSEKFHIIIN
jgi:hypothetical protein